MKKNFTLALLLSVIGVNVFAQSWLITGNSGTTPPSNFLGTTDAKPLVFKTNNSERMRIDKTGNVGIGITTPAAKLDVEGGDAFINGLTIGIGGGQGFGNTATGYKALFSNTFGATNTALGYEALYSNTSGYENTANGYLTLYSNTYGIDNTANGFDALYSNISGNDNTATGVSALYSNTIGNENTAYGSGALDYNTIGLDNTATGYEALFSNVSGESNVANGSQALFYNNGYNNTANGAGALFRNTIGSQNTGTGSGALNFNTKGKYNTATGVSALSFDTTGSENTANGYQALYYNTGSNNTADGYDAGYNVTTGSNNTFLGYNSNSGSQGISSNETAIGNGATVTTSNHMVIGNSSVTSIGGFVNWSNLSDGRVKKNIKQNVPGLAFIDKLQPITYNLDLDAADKIIDRPAMKDKDGKVVQPTEEEIQARQAKEQIIYTGFVAQDVEKAAQSLNYDFSGVDKPDNANTLYGLRYSDFVVPLVKAVQELSAKNDAKDATIASLQADNASLHQQFDALAAKVNQFESTLSQCCASYQSSTSSRQTAPSGQTADAPILEQNAPNPFSQNTTIQFYLPSSASEAMIVVSDLSGKTIQQFNHLSSGNGTITIAAGALTSGTYQYSLILNGKVIDTKQMVLTK